MERTNTDLSDLSHPGNPTFNLANGFSQIYNASETDL